MGKYPDRGVRPALCSEAKSTGFISEHDNVVKFPFMKVKRDVTLGNLARIPGIEYISRKG